jgi:hypothetical protein
MFPFSCVFPKAAEIGRLLDILKSDGQVDIVQDFRVDELSPHISVGSYRTKVRRVS